MCCIRDTFSLKKKKKKKQPDSNSNIGKEIKVIRNGNMSINISHSTLKKYVSSKFVLKIGDFAKQ